VQVRRINADDVTANFQLLIDRQKRELQGDQDNAFTQGENALTSWELHTQQRCATIRLLIFVINRTC
jgi:hypothetical protein